MVAMHPKHLAPFVPEVLVAGLFHPSLLVVGVVRVRAQGVDLDVLTEMGCTFAL